jgi:hypothetical protein
MRVRLAELAPHAAPTPIDRAAVVSTVTVRAAAVVGMNCAVIAVNDVPRSMEPCPLNDPDVDGVVTRSRPRQRMCHGHDTQTLSW